MKEKFFVFVDASTQAVGGVITQIRDKKYHPISFISRKLTKYEQKYSIFELEALAVVYAVYKFRKYLLDKHFIIFTDKNSRYMTTYLMQNRSEVLEKFMEYNAAFLTQTVKKFKF